MKLVMSFIIIILLLSVAGIFFANETTIVTSDNGAPCVDNKNKLQIINCTLQKQENGTYVADGYIRNKDVDLISQAKVTARLYNSNNELIAKSTTNAENIGKYALRFVILTGILNETPARYTIEVKYSKF